jgi:PAS domain S-box-containing protein
MAAPKRGAGAAVESGWGEAAQAMFRAAQAVSHPGGPTLFEDLVRALAENLRVSTVFAAVFADDTRTRLRTLAAVVDGKLLRNFDYPLAGSPCEKVVGHAFRYVPSGVAAEFPPGTIFGAKGMDSYAAFPLNDRADNPLGLLVAMDRQPIADVTLAEALLKIFAGRLVGEIEHGRAGEALRAAALAVSSAGSASVFAELVRYLAAILGVEIAFIARHDAADPGSLRMLAMFSDGRIETDIRYAIAGTPCETVLGRTFRAYQQGLQQCFPDDEDARVHGTQSYAGHPLTALDGTPLGIVSVASRRPLRQLEQVESILKIFAVRAAAEVERLAASEALQHAAASYRTIFEAAEDGIFIHDWESGDILEANGKACEMYGCEGDELRRRPVADIASGIEPYTAAGVLHHLGLAKLGRCPPIEWQRRRKDGSLHWDEVRMKPALIDGRPHVLAFMRDVTERRATLDALALREEQYRAIFETSSDGFILWDENLQVVDANPAARRLYGYRPEQFRRPGFPAELPDAYVQERLDMVRRAMAGATVQVETRSLRADGSWFDVDLRVMPFRHRGQPHVLAIARDITERRERERALLRSEARLRATVDAAFDCVIGMDGEGRIVEFNAAAERDFGYRREEVIGQPLDLIIPERLREAHHLGLQQFQLGDADKRVGRLVETSAVRADGTEIPVEVAIGAARVPEGTIFVGHLRDITERRRAHQALLDSEAQYRGIFNASADALVLRDADFRIVDVNATYEAMSGNTRAEVLGVDRVLANPPAVKEKIRALHVRALAGEPVTLQTQLVRRDGTRYELELRGLPILHRGQPHVLYIGRDITDGKRAEQALRDSEEQYRAIFNASADALLLRDAAYRAVDVNPAYLALTGLGREAVLGADVALALQDPTLQQRHRDRHRAILAGESMRFEVAGMRPDGALFQAEVTGIPLQYRGQPHVLYAARDITERHAAEARRAELERQLRQAQKMEAIGQLTGGIAHDFNNILTSVIGYLVLGQERAETIGDAPLQRQLGQAHLAAQRARDLIAQMLAFARRQRSERHTLSVVPLVRQALQLLRATLPSSVAVDFSGAPGGEDALLVAADPVQMEQVLFNLCINARDAIQGPGLIRVRVGEVGGGWHCASCRARVDSGCWVELSVADDGSGMPPELVERIFEPFTSTKEAGRGSGMGLAMVHGIVHDHEGHVVVETEQGRGSVFRVMLPASGAAATAVRDVRPPEVVRGRARPLAGRVLLVEDERMVGDFMVELLGGWGLEVTWQREPLAALAWLEDEANAADALITDHTMPQMSGLQLARRAAELRPALPVLLYTGNGAEIEADELRRHAVRALLRKPVDAVALRELLQRWLQESGRSLQPV